MRALRFAAPLLVAAVVALAPTWLLALAAQPPPDLAHARSAAHLAYLMIALAVVGQLALAGGAHAIGDATSQATATRRALAGTLRAIVPTLLAVVAVVLGLAALALPGLLLLALLALVGPAAQAADGGPPTAALARAAAAARRQLPALAATVAAIIAVDVVLALALDRLLVSLPAKPSTAELATTVRFIHVTAVALVVASPVAAVALAARYGKNRAR